MNVENQFRKYITLNDSEKLEKCHNVRLKNKMSYLEIWLTPQYIMSLITLGRIYDTALAEVNNLVILTEKTNVIVCKDRLLTKHLVRCLRTS